MKKLVLAVLILTAGWTVFAGGRRDAGSADGTVTVNFYAHSDNEAIIQELVDRFNAKNNGIRVVQHIIANDDYDDKIKVLTAGTSGEMDALWIRTPAQTQQYIANRALADLGSFAAESGIDLSPIRETSLKGAMDSSGKFYGYPTTGSCWMVYYNMDLFDAKGLPYPINLTWDQYLDLAKQLTYTEGGKKYWGGLCPPWTMNLGASAAGEYLTAPEPMPLTRRYAQVLHRMYVDDKSHPGIAEMSVGTFDISSIFQSGSAYMMIMGDWSFTMEAPFRFGVAPLPVFPEAQREASVGQPSYYCISRNSRHQKEAYKFIEFCTATAEGTSVYARYKNVPSYPTPEAAEEYRRLVTLPGVEFRFSSKVAPEQGADPYYGSVNEAFIQELQLYLLGEQSLDNCFKNFFALRKEIIANF
ncbi:MAG: extracellular solute-binding protein [Spirochaetaceae bacterium]|jgi:ABC-type glycerol-3-phosphate transport system substrate-binding protein|nr:extracellular solute-binding protein [Spirochaetaceae bacterium]